MTGVDEISPSGPPARLLTRTEKLRRRRAVALSVVIFGSLAVFLTVAALKVVTTPNADVKLGSETFRVGSARELERRIRVDQFPLLFQDLRDKSIDVFVDHQRGKPFYEGWRAIEAHAPGAPRACQLNFNGSGYTDPCDGRTYPSNGEGLRKFEAKVVNGVVIINFRRVV
ncbi:MAG: hypothetical protein QOI61_262 [Actinomycetota bacterium]